MMDNPTQCIASNIIYMRQIVDYLKNALPSKVEE